MIAVPPLLLDFEQPRHAQARQVGAGRLRRDAGDAGELGGGERTSVHQRVQHARARRVSGKRGDFRERGIAGHR